MGLRGYSRRIEALIIGALESWVTNFKQLCRIEALIIGALESWVINLIQLCRIVAVAKRYFICGGGCKKSQDKGGKQ